VKQNVHLSGRNLPNVHVMPYADASAYHVLWSDAVLIEGTAIGHTLAPIAEKEAAPKKAKRTTAAETKRPTATDTKRAPTAKAAGKKAAAPADVTTAKKPTAKKSAKKKGE